MAGVTRVGVQEFTAHEINLIGRFVRSSIGRKVVMAITGCGLFAFVFVHMMGNLQIFLGRDAINHYGHVLKSNPEFIWPARVGLLACVIVHIITSISLALENRAARPEPYAMRKLVGASLASRTMLWTGGLFVGYIVFHLLHFTVGTVQPKYMEWHDAVGRHDVYRMMIDSFSNPWTSLFYILGTGLICFHLSHGASAMFQSLGWKNQAYTDRISNLAKLVALLIFLGYAAVPLAVFFGVVR